MGRLRDFLATRVLPPPTRAKQWRHSMIFSTWDDPVAPSPRLLDVAARAVAKAPAVDLADVSARVSKGPKYPDVWPGEHYKLLGALMQVTDPKTVVEIGTGTGMSALALKKFLRKDGKVVTFDVVPWDKYPSGVLRADDFRDGRFVQLLDDVTVPAGLEKHRDLLEGADLFFIDAAKDGVMERRLLKLFEGLRFKHRPLLMFDDIRLWNMLAIWREIRRPKLDLTSFGHWSGTGLVDWA